MAKNYIMTQYNYHYSITRNLDYVGAYQFYCENKTTCAIRTMIQFKSEHAFYCSFRSERPQTPQNQQKNAGMFAGECSGIQVISYFVLLCYALQFQVAIYNPVVLGPFSCILYADDRSETT